MAKDSRWYGIAIAGFVLSIVAWFLFFIPGLGLIVSVTALVMGIVAISKTSKQKHLKGKGLAIAAVAIAGLPVLMSLMMSFAVFQADVESGTVADSTNEGIDTIKDLITPGTPIKSAEITIDRIDITVANLYPTRVTVKNTGDVTIRPKFDVNVYMGSKQVCTGRPLMLSMSIAPGESKTDELNIMGCMFTEDGTYKLEIVVMDSEYKTLNTTTKDFEVDYWSMFKF